MLLPVYTVAFIALSMLTLIVGYISTSQSISLSRLIGSAPLKKYFLNYAMLVSLLALLMETFIAQQLFNEDFLRPALRIVHAAVIIMLFVTNNSLLAYNEATQKSAGAYFKYINAAITLAYLAILGYTIPSMNTADETTALALLLPVAIATITFSYYVFSIVASKTIDATLAGLLRNQGNFLAAALATIMAGTSVLVYPDSGFLQIVFTSIALASLTALAMIAAQTISYSKKFTDESWQNQLKKQ